MLYVLFLTCSLVNIGTCRQETIQVIEEPVTPMVCIKYAQPQLARWNYWHPNQRIQKWKCVDETRLMKEQERSL
jgi:hypothetical protein